MNSLHDVPETIIDFNHFVKYFIITIFCIFIGWLIASFPHYALEDTGVATDIHRFADSFELYNEKNFSPWSR